MRIRCVFTVHAFGDKLICASRWRRAGFLTLKLDIGAQLDLIAAGVIARGSIA